MAGTTSSSLMMKRTMFTTFIMMTLVATLCAHAQKQTLTEDTDHYSSPSVRLSADNSDVGSGESKILIENDYEVTYGTYFKIVRMKCGSKHASLNPSTCDKQTYVLHHRGTLRPTVDPVTYANIEAESGGVTTKYFEIPAKNVSVGGSFVLGYLEALGIDGNSGLKMISASWMHSPCMQKAVIAGEIVNQGGSTSAWAAKCDELNIDLALTDSFGTGKCSNAPDVNVNFIGNTDDTSLLRAEWVKFVSLFFDKEALANEYFALESEAYAAITQYVDKGVVKDGVRLKCVWVQKYAWGSDIKYQILYDTFRSTLCTDAGMDAYSGKEGQSTETYFPENIELFHSAIRDYDVVIDETYVSDTASRSAVDYEAALGFEELSGQTVKAKLGNGGKLLRVDASQGNGNTTDLRESGEVRPALILMDLVSKVHGTFGSHKDCTKYFRRVSESVKHVTHEHCEALEAVDAEKKCVTALKEEAESRMPHQPPSPPSPPPWPPLSHCDASEPPKNGGVGNCSSLLPSGQTCKPKCAEGFMLAEGGRQSYCASDGKLSYEAECVFDGCFVIKKHEAQVRQPKAMNEIIVNSDGKGDKTILVSKDEREMHVDVNTLRTKAKQILYANASANNLSVRKRVLAGQNEEIDVEKRLTELRKKAAELRERLLLLKNRFTPPPSPPPSPPPPLTMMITAAEGISGFISNDASISLTFTSSESTSDFTSADVTVTGGGTLTSFTGSGTTYTATFTPSIEGLQSIKVAANAYSDPAGNGNVNVESNTFLWTYDTTSPTITITAAEGISGFISNDASISLTFTSSESTSDFTSADVTVTGGGTLTSFTGSGTTYTATFTPSIEGLQSIKVAANAYSDPAGNGNVNVESNTFLWTYDTTSPTITITAAEGISGFISNDASISLTFTSSESTSDFTSADVTVTGGGTLTSFTGSGTTYTATFTPSIEGLQSIKVAANAYSDPAGNGNVNVESNTFLWTYDTTSPTITITAAEGISGFISNDASISLTFTSSESTSDFTSADVTVTGGGTLTSFTGSGTTYTATFTPSIEGLQSIKVAANAYSDPAGNGNVNVESNTFLWTYDTTSPTITITAAEGISGFISNDASISLTFTSSESTSDFTSADVTVTGGGTLTYFTGSGTTYTATLTPSIEGLQSVKVAANAYSDPAGNGNIESNTFGWTYDVTSPTITITAAEGSSGFISNDASISLTFTLSESTSDFTSADVTVTGGGTLTYFTGSGTTYTATFTPSTEGLQSIKVAANAYSDPAGNGNVNVESNTFLWTYDTTSPTMTITAAEGISGFISNDASISLTFTSSESTSDFTSANVTVTGGGTLTSFTGSGTTYTATFTPSIEGLQSIKVAANAYSDPAGNGNVNVESNTFLWTYSSHISVTSSFESVGTYTYISPQTGMAKVLVVGGGGGGGGRSGGGGGGGAVVYVESYPVVADQTYQVTVGVGGAGGSGIVNSGKNTNGNTDDDPGKAGSKSMFDNLVALGGGGGGSSWHEGGYDGGSGGGGKYGHKGGDSLQSAQSGLSGKYGHGFAGGSGTSSTWNAGGGGGAAAVGESGTSSHCGNGGTGFQSDITETTVTYGGGGGGGSHNPACSSGGEGGAGGGGKNGLPGNKDGGTAGVNGLGGGGGGGSTTSHSGGNGGNGGSGFVAISCCTP